jgi:hypothetical protein
MPFMAYGTTSAILTPKETTKTMTEWRKLPLSVRVLIYGRRSSRLSVIDVRVSREINTRRSKADHSLDLSSIHPPVPPLAAKAYRCDTSFSGSISTIRAPAPKRVNPVVVRFGTLGIK